MEFALFYVLFCFFFFPYQVLNNKVILNISNSTVIPALMSLCWNEHIFFGIGFYAHTPLFGISRTFFPFANGVHQTW
jgi:hypothetical protein